MATINVNGIQMDKARVKLVFASSALLIFAQGMTLRNLNLKGLKLSLAQDGIILSGRTALDCYYETRELIESDKVYNS